MDVVRGKFFPVTDGIHCREDIDDTEIGGLAFFLGFPGEGPDIAVDEQPARLDGAAAGNDGINGVAIVFRVVGKHE